MDYSDETPTRWWVLKPDAHIKASGRVGDLLKACSECKFPLNWGSSIPIKSEKGGLCQRCASQDVSEHPLTPTYLEWLTSGDPRWWSVWTCNCEGCVPHDASKKGVSRPS